jgi:RHS repeat-associated protein
MKKYFWLFMVVASNLQLFGQNQAPSFILNKQISGQQEYQASQYIDMINGFGYKANTKSDVFHAKIDPFLVFPPVEGEIGGPIGGNNNYSGVVGTVLVDATVSGNGNAIVSVPITVCPGISGLIPQLSLMYSSTGSESFLGKGWSLNGLSSITKVAKTKYFDGYPSPVINTNEYEAFAVDGVRLIWDPEVNYFRKEFEDFSKIVKLTDNGQIMFKVWEKDGTIIEYGFTPDSKQHLLNIQGNETEPTIVWHVNKISDIYGNSIEINYFSDGGICYPDTIKYAKSDIHPNGNAINFIYEEQEIVSKYWFEGIGQQPNYCESKQLLTGIEVYSNNKLFRKYVLEYLTHGSLEKKYLNRVIEFNGQLINYYPLEFSWELEDQEYAYNAFQVEDFWKYDRQLFVDLNYKTQIIPSFINEDILPDFYAFTFATQVGKERLVKYINNGNGFTGVDVTSLGGLIYPGYYDSQVFTIGDFNSDSKDDLIFLNQFAVLVYSGGFRENPSPSQVFDKPSGSVTQALAGDFNGDGISDLLLVNQRRFIGIPPKALVYFGSISGLSESPDRTIEISDVPIDATDVSIQIGDFNGDGVSDIFTTYNLRNSPTAVQRIFQYSSVQDDFIEIPSFIIFAREGKYTVQLGDFNGDSKSDILWVFDESMFNTNKDVVLMLSTGNGHFTNSIMYENYPDLLNVNSSTFIVADFNNDGKSDIFQYHNNLPFENKLFIINREGNHFDYVHSIQNIFIVPPPSCHFQTMFLPGDFNGDGNIDMLNMFESTCPADWQWEEDYRCMLTLELSQKSRNNFLTKVTNSIGYETLFSYKFMSDPDVYSQTASYISSYPLNIFKGNLPLVNEMKTSTGLNSYSSVKYTYELGLTNITGKGFIGFKKRTINDSASGVITEEVSEENFENLGILTPGNTKHSVVKSGELQVISETSVETDKISFGPELKSHFIYTRETQSKDYEYQTYKTNKFLYPDQYGNYSRVENHSGLIGAGQDEHYTVIDNTFINITNNGKYIPGRLMNASSTQKYLDKPPVYRHSSFSYYPNGTLESETIEPGNAKSTTKYYYYDIVGNVVESKLTALGLASVNNTSVYDEENKYISKLINNIGHITEMRNYDINGNPKTFIDENILETKIVYDDFGRMTKTVFPNDVQSQLVYRWVNKNDEDAPVNSVYYTWECSSGNQPVIKYYNKLARQIRAINYDFHGDKVFLDTWYDQKGRLEKTSEPYKVGDEPLYTTYLYDYLNRPIEIRRPGSINDTFIYNECEVKTINSLNQITSTKVNSLDWVISTKDNSGNFVKIEYSSAGNKTRTYAANSSGNEIAGTSISYAYDIFGNCITVNDPSLGPRGYIFNAFGELVKSIKIEKNISSEYVYDGLGRMVYRIQQGDSSTGDILTTWIYDTKPYGKGLLDKVIYPGNTEEYFYDKFSRPKQITTSIGEDSFTFSTVYDVLGRVSKTIYPTGIITMNEYNRSGFLYRIINNKDGKELWKADDYNIKGQLIKEITGAIISTEYVYQDFVNLVQDIDSKYNGSKIQSLTFNWHKNGNLSTRTDNLRRISEIFGYDGLNRLTSYWSTINSEPTEIEYDILGNISRKSDVGTYEYEPNKPYKLISINCSSDAISHLTQNISYTSFDKISEIEEGGSRLNLTYGYNHNRIKRVFKKPNGETSTRLYINGLIEKNIDNGVVSYDNYIFGGNGLCSIITTDETESSPDIYKFILKDHLGSVQMVVNEAGTILEEFNFDPWGRRRNPVNLDYINNTISHVTDRGFTGHEHLDIFALVNMNGRVFDPVIGRFTSPDIILQNPYSTQGLNRYAYCLNNPLSMTDPSGHYAGSSLNRSITSAAVTFTVGAICPPLAPVAAAIFSMSAVISNGGSFNNAIFAGENAFKYSLVNVVGNELIGDYFSNDKLTGNLIAKQMLVHGAFQGTMSVAQGGKFIHGFFSGALATAAGSASEGMNFTERVLIGAVAGGLGESMSGGKFLNGAVTGAYVMMFNHLTHQVEGGSNKRDYATRLAKRYQNNEDKIIAGSLVAEALLEITEPGKILAKYRELFTETYGTEQSKESMKVYSQGVKIVRQLNKSFGNSGASNIILVKTSAAILSEVLYLQIENGFISNTVKLIDRSIYEQFIKMNFHNSYGGGGASTSWD